MVKLKGQFMLVSAIIVSLLLMSTAATMTEIGERTYQPMDKGYHINNLEQIGTTLDLASKSDRKQFREATNMISEYSIDLTYWNEERCYNVTLTNPSTETRLTCVGNGSVFNDGFEDGEYRNPTWTKNSRDGTAKVVKKYSPDTGIRALRLSETENGDTAYSITWTRNTAAFTQKWTAKGLFYTEDLSPSTAQKLYVVINHNETEDNPLKLRLGFYDNSGNQLPFRIMNEGLVTNTASDRAVNFQEDTWYRWELKHTGSGNYEARMWQQGTTRPSTPGTEASGVVPSYPTAGFKINGTGTQPFKVSHAYFKLARN